MQLQPLHDRLRELGVATPQSKLTQQDETTLLRAAILLDRFATVIDAGQLDGRLTKGNEVRREAQALRRICRTSVSETGTTK